MKKTTVFKRITALAVVTATLFAVMVTGGVHAEESKQMTTQLFYTKLASFISDVYANGSKYVNNSSLYRGIQCYGFANQLSKYMYGSFPVYNSSGHEPYADWTVSYGSEALMTLHIGDVVRYRSSAGADHSIFITGMDDENVYFSDANNDGKNTVRHNASMTWQKLIGKIDKALQANSKYTGWVAHYLYWDDDPDHAGVGTVLNFSANGGQIPSVQIADRYIVLDTLNMRSGPGLSYSRIAKMYDDTYFDIKCGAEFVESDGYVWAPVTQGSNSGWSVVSVDEWCKRVDSVYDSSYFISGEDGLICKTDDFKKLSVVVRDKTSLPDAEELGLTREDHDFIGWSRTPDGEPVDIKALLENVNESPLTLYAVWSQKSVEEESTAEDDPAELTFETETDEFPFTGIRGDINGDGEINNKDVVVLFSILSNSKKCDPDIGDINEDGEVDNKDIIALFRELSTTSDNTDTTDTENTDTTDTENTDTTETENIDTTDTENIDTTDPEETQPQQTETAE